MIAVIFEVEIRPGRVNEYLETAGNLLPKLQSIEGFLSIERFQSLSKEGKLLSLSFWRDEESVARWRNEESHREAQLRGRGDIFEDYRLRIGAIVRDYGMIDRAEVPDDSRMAIDLNER